jgi:hypothetical protein
MHLGGGEGAVTQKPMGHPSMGGKAKRRDLKLPGLVLSAEKEVGVINFLNDAKNAL